MAAGAGGETRADQIMGRQSWQICWPGDKLRPAESCGGLASAKPLLVEQRAVEAEHSFHVLALKC